MAAADSVHLAPDGSGLPIAASKHLVLLSTSSGGPRRGRRPPAGAPAHQHRSHRRFLIVDASIQGSSDPVHRAQRLDSNCRIAVVFTGGTIESLGTDRLDLAWYIENASG